MRAVQKVKSAKVMRAHKRAYTNVHYNAHAHHMHESAPCLGSCTGYMHTVPGDDTKDGAGMSLSTEGQMKSLR